MQPQGRSIGRSSQGKRVEAKSYPLKVEAVWILPLLANSVGLPAAATMLQQVYAELQVKAGVDHSTLIWVDYD
jgi:hypothetical protein